MEELRSMFWTFTSRIIWLKSKKFQSKILVLILIHFYYKSQRFQRFLYWRIILACLWKRKSFMNQMIWFVEEPLIFLGEKCLFLIAMNSRINFTEKDLELPNLPCILIKRIPSMCITPFPHTQVLEAKKILSEALKLLNQKDPNLTRKRSSNKTFTFLDSNANWSQLNQMMKTEFSCSHFSAEMIQFRSMKNVIKIREELEVNSLSEKLIKIQRQVETTKKRIFCLERQYILEDGDSKFSSQMSTQKNTCKIMKKFSLRQAILRSLTKLRQGKSIIETCKNML